MQFTHYFNVIINKKQKELKTEIIEGELKNKSIPLSSLLCHVRVYATRAIKNKVPF